MILIITVYLVTGAVGFIGANYLKYILSKHKNEEIRVIVVDALTYAGNLGTIAEEIKDKRVKFEKVALAGMFSGSLMTSKYKLELVGPRADQF